MPFSDDRGQQLVGLRGFEPLSGVGVQLAVTAASQALTPTQVIPAGGCEGLFTNIGTQTVYIVFDGGTASITTSAPILANTQVVFGIKSGAVINAIAAASGSTLALNLGNGN